MRGYNDIWGNGIRKDIGERPRASPGRSSPPGFGGLVLCAKPEEPALWSGYASETGRGGDLVMFGAGEGWSFNFMQYESLRSGAGAGLTENLRDPVHGGRLDRVGRGAPQRRRPILGEGHEVPHPQLRRPSCHVRRDSIAARDVRRGPQRTPRTRPASPHRSGNCGRLAGPGSMRRGNGPSARPGRSTAGRSPATGSIIFPPWARRRAAA